jgi:glycosyltransferase involved in cell wall biosynthesis
MRSATSRLCTSVLTRLKSVASWYDRRRPMAPIENWSAPLIHTRSGIASSEDLLAGAVESTNGIGVVEPVLSHVPAMSASAQEDALRCLIVTSALDVGGMDEVAAFLARRLPSQGLQTAVLHATNTPSPTGKPTGRLGRMLQSSGIEVYEADESRARNWIEQWRPDVISAHGCPDWMVMAAQQFGVPYVDTLHGMHTHFSADWVAEAARAAKISAIVSVSELVRQQYLMGNSHFPSDRIVTIPNGVDDERRVSSDRTAVRARLGLTDEYVLVSLGRHVLQKNSYRLIAAFAELAQRHPQAHMVIAGAPRSSR